jgi:FkbM family methyltransferase
VNRFEKSVRQATSEASQFCDAWADGTPPKLIVMVGVGLGTESKVFKSRWPNCKVIGVDPYPQRAEDFDPSCELIGGAIVADPSLTSVDFYWRRGKTIASSLYPKTNGVGDVKQVVPAMTLDSLFVKSGRPDSVGLWMDCEGAELAAMLGGVRCVAMTKLVMVETFTKANRVGYPSRSEVFKHLENEGFSMVISHRANSIWRRN